MRILHVNEHLAEKGGVEIYLLALLPLLTARGHEVHCAYGAGDAARHAHAWHVPELSCAAPRTDRRAYRAMEDLCRRLKPDVIHLHGILSLGALQACLDTAAKTVSTLHDFRLFCPAATLYRRNTRTVCGRLGSLACYPITLRQHCMTPRPGPAWAAWHRTRWFMRNVGRLHALICPSQDARTRVARGLPSGLRSPVLPYFCPLEPATTPRPVPETPQVTMIGRIAPNKGWDVFLQALGRLPAPTRGLLIGNFTHAARSRVDQMARAAHCSDRLDLQPWAGRDEVLAALRSTTVLAFPSLWPETLGISGVEALSQGVPVVASDVGGVREWLHEGRNGRLVRRDDVPAMAEAMASLLALPDDALLAMGRAGLETVRADFSPDGHVDRLEAIYTGAT